MHASFHREYVFFDVKWTTLRPAGASWYNALVTIYAIEFLYRSGFVKERIGVTTISIFRHLSTGLIRLWEAVIIKPGEKKVIRFTNFMFSLTQIVGYPAILKKLAAKKKKWYFWGHFLDPEFIGDFLAQLSLPICVVPNFLWGQLNTHSALEIILVLSSRTSIKSE